MIYLLTLVFLAVYFLLMALMFRQMGRGRRSRLSDHLCRSAWERQRWGISLFNGRHNLGFGYYLHRST